MSYFTLLERTTSGGRWYIIFGSYDKAEVQVERLDAKLHGARDRDLKIIMTDPAQHAVEAAVAKLNA